MTGVVIVYCGRETRTAFVANRDANGDARTEAAASIIAQHQVDNYILATGPTPSFDIMPALWPFPLSNVLDLHTHIPRFQRRLGSGPHSQRAAVMRAIKATKRTVSSAEIDAYLGLPAPETHKPERKRSKILPPSKPAKASGKPVQLNLF